MAEMHLEDLMSSGQGILIRWTEPGGRRNEEPSCSGIEGVRCPRRLSGIQILPVRAPTRGTGRWSLPRGTGRR